MDCVGCGSAAVTERPDLTAQGYHRFRCRDCGKQFNERSDGVLNRASLPSDIIAFVVFCRLRYRLTLRDLSEIMLLRGFTVSHECIRQWEAKLLPVMGEALRKRRHGTGRSSGQSWYVDETYLKVQGRWCYLYRAIGWSELTAGSVEPLHEGRPDLALNVWVCPLADFAGHVGADKAALEPDCPGRRSRWWTRHTVARLADVERTKAHPALVPVLQLLNMCAEVTFRPSSESPVEIYRYGLLRWRRRMTPGVTEIGSGAGRGVVRGDETRQVGRVRLQVARGYQP